MRNTAFRHFVLFAICFCSESAIPSIGNEEGCPDGYYGYNCRHHCHCRNRSDCDVTTRCHGDCADGWSGPTCQSQNIAFGMPSKIRTRDPDLSSRAAVDGNSSTCVTSDPGNPGWLRVDLQVIAIVYHVTLVTDGTSPRDWQLFVTEYSDFYWATPCATVRSDMSHVQMSCDSPSAGRYVTVLNTQGPLTVCEIQTHVCADYTFGRQCEMTCQCADASEMCHPLTGHCRTGCRPGFTGRDCQQQCRMTFGSSCVNPCGQCSRGVPCDPVTGACPGSCQPGWTGDKCDTACEAGRYGDRCATRCGGCQDNAACAPDTGLCPGQCRAGLQGPRCDQECDAGRQGPSCQFHCGHCLPGSTCNATTGMCPRGCASGWEGLFCTQECLPLNYGVNCLSKCRHCLTSCDSHTGQCDVNGCSAGRTGRMCNRDCKAGFYGLNCSGVCGQCAKGPCDVISGHCSESLCKPGWQGQLCDKACPARRYGANCSLECGSCEGADICDHVTGKCPGGCEERYYGEMCQTLLIYKDTTSKTSIILIASILTIVILVMVIVCVCLALKWRRDQDNIVYV